MNPAYYCSKDCQVNHWPAHRDAHKIAKKNSKMMARRKEEEEEAADVAALDEEKEPEPSYEALYVKLGMMAQEMYKAGNYAHAAKLCRKAIKVWPKEPNAYETLGKVCAASADYRGAVQNSLLAMLRYESQARSKDRADMIVAVIGYWYEPTCSDITMPPFWNDEDLLTLTAQILHVLPNSSAAYSVRAKVLSAVSEGQPSFLNEAVRSPEQLREACRCYKRAAELSPEPYCQADFMKNARDCIVRSLRIAKVNELDADAPRDAKWFALHSNGRDARTVREHWILS